MNKIKSILTVMILALSSIGAFAQDAAPAVEKAWHEYEFDVLVPIVFLIFILGLLIILLGGLMIQFGVVYRQKLIDDGATDLPGIIKVFGLFEGDSEVLTGVYEDEVIEGHDYDGIEEFDNNLPPWWVGMFYLTIVFSVIYLGYYYVFDGKTQEEEYLATMAEAEAQFKDIDEVYDAPMNDQAAIAEAVEIFIGNCAACHREDLGGSIGPNLTDKYWKHGGGINDIYKTVKYGIQNTAMKSWQNEFDNDQIYAISSYIMSKQGSNPENPKDKEGEIYEGE